MNLNKELAELVQSGVIDSQTAERIALYLQQKKKKNSVFSLLSVLSALFIGLGIILLAAHNWDYFSREIKTVLSLFPLVIGQGACIYWLIKPSGKKWYIESFSLFTALAIGLSIAMVHQIYNLQESDVEIFLLAWLLLSLPLVYIFGVQSVAVFYLLGVILFGIQSGEEYIHWFKWLFLGICPFYIYLIYKKKHNLSLIHYGMLCSMLIYLMPIYSWSQDSFIYILNFTGIMLLLGKYLQRYERYNAYIIYGFAHITVILFSIIFFDLRVTMPIYLSYFFYIYLVLLAWYAYVNHYKEYDLVVFYPLLLVVAIGLGWIGFSADVFLFVFALFYLIRGMQNNQLVEMNYGALVLMLQIGFRFFDSDISFIFKGGVFIILGVCFFLMNYIMFKKKSNS